MPPPPQELPLRRGKCQLKLRSCGLLTRNSRFFQKDAVSRCRLEYVPNEMPTPRSGMATAEAKYRLPGASCILHNWKWHFVNRNTHFKSRSPLSACESPFFEGEVRCHLNEWPFPTVNFNSIRRDVSFDPSDGNSLDEVPFRAQQWQSPKRNRHLSLRREQFDAEDLISR